MSEDGNSQCCEGDECDCGFDIEEEVKQLRREVDQLREDVDFIIERKGLRELMDDE